jgi:hypothetical protein
MRRLLPFAALERCDWVGVMELVDAATTPPPEPECECRFTGDQADARGCPLHGEKQ